MSNSLILTNVKTPSPVNELALTFILPPPLTSVSSRGFCHLSPYAGAGLLPGLDRTHLPLTQTDLDFQHHKAAEPK